MINAPSVILLVKPADRWVAADGHRHFARVGNSFNPVGRNIRRPAPPLCGERKPELRQPICHVEIPKRARGLLPGRQPDSTTRYGFTI